MAAQFLQLVGQGFPEEAKMAIDGTKTIENIRDKMRVAAIIAMRDPKQVQQFIDRATKLLSGSAPGAPQQPGQEAPAAGPLQ